MQADADRQKQIQADIDIYTDTYKIIQICTGLWIRCSDYTVVSQETASRKVSVTWCNLLCKWHSSKGNQGQPRPSGSRNRNVCQSAKIRSRHPPVVDDLTPLQRHNMAMEQAHWGLWKAVQWENLPAATNTSDMRVLSIIQLCTHRSRVQQPGFVGLLAVV